MESWNHCSLAPALRLARFHGFLALILPWGGNSRCRVAIYMAAG